MSRRVPGRSPPRELRGLRRIPAALLLVLAPGCLSGGGDPIGDDDASGDDDAVGDDDTAGDDDASGDDDAGDDDASGDDDAGDDDASGDDDTAGDDDTVGDDDTAADCAAIPAADADWSLCAGEVDRCEAVFDDGAGCSALCAAAGLPCTGAWENRDGACAPDLSRAAVACDSGHASDFCVCGGDGTPVTADPIGARAASLLAERVGFGAGATGGDPAQLYRVTTLADTGPGSLRAALESTTPWWIVFDVDGTITWDDWVDVGSNKTVDGRGRSVVVDGTWRFDGVHDVIVSDLELTRSLRSGETACEQSGDVIVVYGDGGASPGDFDAYDLWFHHLDMHDGGDGLIDLRGATGVTISWVRFHDHKKVSLAWQDRDGGPTGGMRVTLHHNHFDHTTVRNPRFHYGWLHAFNNHFDGWWQYGIASYDGAQVFSEGNVFDAEPDCVGIPGVSPCEDSNPCGDDNDWFVDRSVGVTAEGEGNAPGQVRSAGDLLRGGALVEEREPSMVFDPAAHYAWTLDAATAGLAVAVDGGVGPRVGWTP